MLRVHEGRPALRPLREAARRPPPARPQLQRPGGGHRRRPGTPIATRQSAFLRPPTPKTAETILRPPPRILPGLCRSVLSYFPKSHGLAPAAQRSARRTLSALAT